MERESRFHTLKILMVFSAAFLVYFFYQNQTAHLLGVNLLANQLNRKLSLAVEHSPVSVMVTDSDGVIEYVNSAFEEMSGFSKEEVIGKNPRILQSGLTSPETYKKMWQAIAAGQVWSGEIANRKKSGELYWELLLIASLKDEKGQITHYVGVKKEITERKRIEEELRESEERFRGLFEYSISGVALHEMILNDQGVPVDFRYLKVNPAFDKQSGLLGSQVLGRLASEVIPGIKETSLIQKYGTIALGGEPIHFETYVLSMDRHYDIQVFGLGYRQFATVFRDITDRIRMDDELKKAKEEAEKASQAKSDFLAMMSHDLRTPLNAIIGFGEILREDQTLTAEQKEHAATIVYCGDALLTLINDILDISKIEAGKLELANAPFDFKVLVEDIVRSVSLKIKEKNLYLKVLRPEKSLKLLADSQRLRQILFNLISNAIKFTSQGGVTLDTQVKALPSGRSLITVTVEDTGSGIKPEELEKLFTPFVQANSDGKTRKEGTGLGLVICRKIAQKMGGDVVLKSFYGRGTCAVFTFEADAVEASIEKSTPGRVLMERNENVRVLVVDDTPSNLRLFNTILYNITPHIDLAASAAEAMELVERNTYTHFLIDIMMPETDGVECMKQIRSVYPSPACYVAVTGFVAAKSRETYLEAGFDHYISKPINLNEFKTIFGKVG